jgi:hypothetical protein
MRIGKQAVHVPVQENTRLQSIRQKLQKDSCRSAAAAHPEK